MLTKYYSDIIGKNFRSELEGFIQELYRRMVRPSDTVYTSDITAITAMNDIRKKAQEECLKKDDVFRLETEIRTGIAGVLPEEDVPIWILLSLGLYLSSAPETDGTGKPASAFRFLLEAIPDAVYRHKDTAPALMFLLSSCTTETDHGFYTSLCGKVQSAASVKYAEQTVFDPVIRRLWDKKEYGKAVLLCRVFGECTQNTKYGVYGTFFSAGKSFAERKYEDAYDALKNCKIKENDQQLQTLIPWLYYDAALYGAWLLKTKTGNEKEKTYQYCAEKLQKAEDTGKNDPATKDFDRLHLLIQTEREYLEMERGIDAEETSDDQKHGDIQLHYQNAFSYFWTVWSAHKGDWNTFRETDIVDHIWCMIKTLAYVPEQGRIVKDQCVSDREIIDCIRFMYENGKDDPSYRHLSVYGPVIRYIASASRPSGIHAKLLIVLLRALEILHTSRIRDFDNYTFYFYTSFSSLKYILSDDKLTEDKADCLFRLPMFHAEHMNDPEEGCLLRNYFCSRSRGASWLLRKPKNGRTVYGENHVFLKSFSFIPADNGDDIKEYLPMWNMYADQTKGCCVILDSRTFSHDMQLRRVYYLKDEPNALELSMDSTQPQEDRKRMQYYLERFAKEFESLLNEAGTKLKNDNELQEIMNSILDRVSYLFKKETYQYENEVRLIKFMEDDELNSLRYIPGDTPKAYWYYNRQTYIKEVILGAKFVNPNDFIPFLQNQGRKMWAKAAESEKKGSQSICVSHSKLQYR